MTSPATSGTSLPAEGHTRQRGSLLILLAWAGFAALVLYAVLIGGSWIGIYWLGLRIVSLAMVAIGLATWLAVAYWRPEWRPATAIWPALALPLGALAVATLLSRFPRLGLEYLAWAVLLVALYLLLVRLMAFPYARSRIGVLAAALGLVIGLFYLGVILNAWLEWWGLVGRLDVPPLRPHTAGLTYRNPNAVATVVVLLAGIAWAGLAPGSAGRRIMLVAVSVVAATTTVVSGSRSAWMALALSGALLGGLYVLSAIRGSRWRSIAIGRRTMLAAALAILALIVLGGLLAPSIGSRVLKQGDGGRSAYFATAVRMFEDAPLLGTGPGTWAVQRAAYTQPGELDWYVTHAHNMYLQVLAEVGLVGALAGVAAVASVAWLMWRAFRGGDSLRRRWAWGALFVFTYLGIASLVDNYANMPAVMLLAAIPLAVLDGSADRRLGIPGLSLGLSRRLASLVRAALWVACLVAIVGLARSESIASEHARAVGLIDDGDWEAAAPLVTSASSADPDMIAYQVTRGQVASQMDDWATALDAYRRAAETDDLPASWLGVAQAQLGLGGPTADVAESLARALRIGTQQEGILYAAASIFDRLGLVDEADDAYAAAIVGMPSLAADPYWMSDPDLVARFVGIRDQAIERAGTSGWSVALMAGDVDRARHLAASLPPGGHERESLVVEAWAGGEEAMGELRRQVAADPRDSWLHSWASLIQLRRGAPQEADRLRRLATFNWEGGELPGFEFRRGEDDEPGEVPAGTRGAYYGEWLYRRSMPIRQLPPGLPQLVYQDFGLTE